MLLKIPGFPTGTHTDSSGFTREFTESQLSACAAVYSPDKHEAPIVIGHPGAESELPHGWVERLEFEDGRLTAYAGRLSGEMFKMLENNQARKYSFAFYLENHPSNPAPGVLYLRHVGIVAVPAIKDNPEPEMQFKESFTIQFSEEIVMAEETNKTAPATAPVSADFAEHMAKLHAQENALKQREAALAEKELAAKEREISAFTESLVSEGRILPRQKGGLDKFLAALPDKPVTLTFSEPTGERHVDSSAWLKEFLKELPKQVEFAELSKADGKSSAPDGEMNKLAAEIAAGAK